MTEKALGPLGRYAERLEQIDPGHLAALDPWFEGALASVKSPVTGATATLAATKLGLVGRVALIVALVTPPAVGVIVLEQHHLPSVAALEDSASLELDDRPGPPPVVSRLALAPLPEPAAPPAAPLPEAAVITKPSRPAAPPRSSRSRPRPSPLIPALPGPASDAAPSPEELAMIDRARSLAHQAGREAEAEAEYISLIEKSQNQHIVEVAYRELITKLVTDQRFDDARRYVEEYSQRFPNGRYLRRFQIMTSSSQ